MPWEYLPILSRMCVGACEYLCKYGAQLCMRTEKDTMYLALSFLPYVLGGSVIEPGDFYLFFNLVRLSTIKPRDAPSVFISARVISMPCYACFLCGCWKFRF